MNNLESKHPDGVGVSRDRLSANFTLKEIVRSQTATRLGGAVLAAQQNPPEEIVQALRMHCLLTVQPARDFFAASINISSGYRSPALNKAIGGSNRSQHTAGEATDQELHSSFLGIQGGTAREAKELLHSLVLAITGKPIRGDVNANFYLFAFYVIYAHHHNVDQLIHEFGEKGCPDWVHVSSKIDIDSPGRREILIATKEGKKTVYKKLNTKQALLLGC